MTTAYYAGREHLDALIDDVFGDVREVVKEVERLVSREHHAARYYREHPELLFAGHPWLQHVATGAAEYLGWAKDSRATGNALPPPPRGRGGGSR